MTFFEDLFGFREPLDGSVRQLLNVDGEVMTSTVNGRSFRCGRLETPSLAELRGVIPTGGRLRVCEVVGDVRQLHADPRSEGATFQVASQFNLLEMVGPSRTPAEGVEIYEFDRTQGPACAIACAPGTVYRNWFARVPGVDRPGQDHGPQLDMAADLHDAFGRDCWEMRNGYLWPDRAGLLHVGSLIADAEASGRLDELRRVLRVGLQRDTEVVVDGVSHVVDQAYCSAVPVAYSGHSAEEWEPLARLVLEAAYEATMWAAVQTAERTGNPTVCLTLLGGGAFGNPSGWIFDAVRRAIDLFAAADLDVVIVSYGASRPAVRALER